MSNIKDKLAEEIADIEWSSLIPHAQRDALIVVHENLSLIDVGLAFAGDNAPLVQQWISQQLIHKPTIDELSAWNVQSDKMFKALIVQPFVLICPDE